MLDGFGLSAGRSSPLCELDIVRRLEVECSRLQALMAASHSGSLLLTCRALHRSRRRFSQRASFRLNHGHWPPSTFQSACPTAAPVKLTVRRASLSALGPAVCSLAQSGRRSTQLLGKRHARSRTSTTDIVYRNK